MIVNAILPGCRYTLTIIVIMGVGAPKQKLTTIVNFGSGGLGGRRAEMDSGCTHIAPDIRILFFHMIYTHIHIWICAFCLYCVGRIQILGHNIS